MKAPAEKRDDGIIDDDEAARLEASGLLGRLPEGPTPVRLGAVLAIKARVALAASKRCGRMPPHDLEAERGVLSAVLLDPSALPRVRRVLDAADFYSDAHRRIFAACLAIRAAGGSLDVVDVATWLREREELEEAGGVAYLIEILEPTLVTSRKVIARARTIREKAHARSLVARRGRP